MARAWKVRGLEPKGSVAHNAPLVVIARVTEALSYEPRARDEQDLDGLHNMRIAIKRLRYSMELFRDCFCDRFRQCLKDVEQLQEQLGSVHDCDVLCAYLSDALDRAPKAAALGVRRLLERTVARRVEEHAQLRCLLDRHRASHTWTDILSAMSCVDA